MMGEARVPCACEADVYGAVTQAILQKVANAPVFLADLVDMDVADDTGVVWHCGQAPVSMTEDEPMATVHTNRKQALLYEFTLKPGRVTFFRLSQAFGEAKVIIAGGEMLRSEMAFTGTSGVVRFDHAAQKVLGDVMDSGLEHHMALAYGDHRAALRGIAAGMGLNVIELGAA
jgi:L-fucose isomerase-like protein